MSHALGTRSLSVGYCRKEICGGVAVRRSSTCLNSAVWRSMGCLQSGRRHDGMWNSGEKRYSETHRMRGVQTSSSESMTCMPVDCRSVSTRRWHFLSREDLAGRQWLTQVQEASSLDEIASVERAMRIQLDLRRYNELVEECERRPCVLHKLGRLSAESLCNFVSFRCQDWQTLSLAVGWGALLLQQGFFSLESMSEFLFQVSLRRERGRARCDRLQSIVDILEKNMYKMPGTWLLRGVYGASFILTLRVDSLMNGVDQLYSERLHELSSEEVMGLVLACCRLHEKSGGYDGRSLCLKFLTVYSGQLKKFSASECVKLLWELTYTFPEDGYIRKRLVDEFSFVEGSLAQAMGRLRNLEVAQLCTAFNILSYEATTFPFKYSLLQRMETLSTRNLVDIFHYVSKYDVIDARLVRRLLTSLSNIKSWGAYEVDMFVGSLRLQHIFYIPEGRVLAVAVENEVLRRVYSSTEAFSAAQCASLFYSLVRLEMNNSLALPELFTKALANLKDLSLRKVSLFVEAFAYWKRNSDHVVVFREAIRETDINHWRLTLQQISFFCKVFVHMRLVEESWLKAIALFYQQSIPSAMISQTTVLIAHSLSLLGFRDVELFREICKWLDEHSLQAINVWGLNGLVSVLWSCMFQDVYPKKALAQLRSLTPSAVWELTAPGQQALCQINLLWMQISGNAALHSDTLEALLRVLSENCGQFPAATKRCLHGIVNILPDKHALLDVTSAEGCRVNCTILKNQHGQSVTWPESTPKSPSAADIKWLVGCGLQPIALLLFGRRWLDSETSSLLGPAKMMCRALEGCGWEVLVILTLDYELAVDKKDFLHSQFGNAGIKIDV